MTPPVLVACPTFAGKRYALDAYLAAYEALDYEPRHLFMVDNTRGSDRFHRELVGRGVDAIHIEPGGSMNRIAGSWSKVQHEAYTRILARAVEGGYPWILSLEADVIAPPEALSFLVASAAADEQLLVLHPYPVRASVDAGAGRVTAELGCTLIATPLLQAALEAAIHGRTHFLSTMVHLAGERMLEVTNSPIELEHLDGGDADRWPFRGTDLRKVSMLIEHEAARWADGWPL